MFPFPVKLPREVFLKILRNWTLNEGLDIFPIDLWIVWFSAVNVRTATMKKKSHKKSVLEGEKGISLS